MGQCQAGVAVMHRYWLNFSTAELSVILSILSSNRAVAPESEMSLYRTAGQREKSPNLHILHGSPMRGRMEVK